MTTPQTTREPEAELFEAGRRYRRATGVRHVFQLPADWMTIAFLVDSTATLDSPYPKYTLRSTDGAFDETLTAKDDLVQGDRWLELRFEHLLPGKQYSLTVHHDAELREVVFDRVDFLRIVDQPRAMHDLMEGHAFATSAVELGETIAVDDWRAQRTNGETS